MSIIYEALKKVERQEKAPGRQLRKKTFVSPPPKTVNFKGKLFFFVFAAVAVVSFYVFLEKHSKVAFNAPLSLAPQPAEKVSLPVLASAEKAIPVQERAPQNLAEPAPVPGKDSALEAEEGQKYYLQGIIYDEQRPLALINGKKVGLGDIIDEARLTQVSQEGVEIETETGRIFLPLDYE